MELNHALAHHGVGHLHEAGDVGALHVVDVAVGLASELDALLVDVAHDGVELLVHFLGAPLQVHGVLAHFQARGGYAACVHGLAGSVDDACCQEGVDGFGGAAHVADFGHEAHAVLDELTGVVAVHLVLRGAGQGDVHFALPGLASGEELAAGELLGIRSHDVVAAGAELQHVVYLLGVEAGGVVDVAVGAGDGDNLGTQLGGLEGCAPCHIAEARDSHGLALNGLALLLEDALHEVEGAEAGGLRADARAAEAQALARECAVVLVDEALVHAVHVAHLAAAHAYVACGHVAVGTEVLPETEHEGLAETHDLAVALAAGREVAAALGAAHGQRGEGVLEGLLEAEELQDAEVDGSVEADAALVRADGVVELYAVAYVVLYFALVVDPCHAEGDDAVGLDHALDDFVALEFGMLIVDVLYGHEHLFYGLKIFLLAGVLGLEVGHDFVNIHEV